MTSARGPEQAPRPQPSSQGTIPGSRIASGVVAALGAWVLQQSSTFDLQTPAGPWLLPGLAGALLLILGVAGVVLPERGTAEPWAPALLLRLGLVMVTLVAFLALLSIAGFLVASIFLSLAFAAIARVTLRLRGAVLLTGVVTAAVLFILFAYVFKVPLPGPASLGGGG